MTLHGLAAIAHYGAKVVTDGSETRDLTWVLPVAVQIGLPIVLALITSLVTWGVSQTKAKNDRAAQLADFDGKKKAAALARDKQLFDTQQAIIDKLQAANTTAGEREERMDRKFDQLYASLGFERAYSMEWEEWHSNGMPNPPGIPKRRHLAQPPAT
ncbi:hypothetical protein AL755_08455 [Arthrobacter sp. ERGS1:01]|uniref:hypothetical protein n=1 Tax=Arthrobacter sp. ERGS1:01 TaxID=1704044 RepID=UPI0006B4C8FE|nr:hypothetical protein [Arthrobacter sp. ERGS1:01]ALE05502.1 hypothetical protein AL755_08455 [Arthrobacter sp. ERGS1:01]